MTGTQGSHEKTKSVVRDHWNRRAPTFDGEASHGLLSPEQGDAWRALLQDIAGPDGLDILDVGCGTGFLALQLAELGHRAVGVDIAGEMLSAAQRKAAASGLAVQFLEGDAEAPPFITPQFDLICMRHVIWTLPNPEGAARKWRELLRPGGRLVLIEGNFGSKPKDDYIPIADDLPLMGGRSSAAVIAVLEAVGFSDVTSRPLMDAALWQKVPTFERYLVEAKN